MMATEAAASGSGMVKTLAVSIQGKVVSISHDKELFWLNRRQAKTQRAADPKASTAKIDADPFNAFISVPHALILHSSFIADSDGGSLLLRLLAPPQGVERSTLPPFTPGKSRAAQLAELCADLDKQGILRPSERLAKQLSGPCAHLRLVNIEARIQDPTQANEAAEWAEALMKSAYIDTKPFRRLFVLVNPQGGPGKAVQLYHTRVKPILEAAGCTIDACITTHAMHGTELATQLSLQKGYDAIVCVSGDGMLHEVLNGLAKRPDAEQALQLPLVPIPAGSGNAVSLNLLGVEHGFNLALASLNAIKGKPMPVDVCCVTQSKGVKTQRQEKIASRKSSLAKRKALLARKTSVQVSEVAAANGENEATDAVPEFDFHVDFSCLSQAIGLMADLDLGTEHLRALGDTRFVLGFLNGVISNVECEVDLYVKLGEKGTLSRATMRDRALRAQKDAVAVLNSDEATEHVVHTKPAFSENGQAATKASTPKLRHGPVTELLASTGPADLPVLVPVDPSWPKTLLAPGNTDVTTPDTDQWYKIQTPISSLYAGKIPYVGRDLMQFPYAVSHDGCIDLTLMLHKGGRLAKLRGISSAETGEVIYDPSLVYIKCEAYRVVPRLPAGHKRLKGGGLVAIDGEAKPYAPFQVEVSDQMRMRVLSLFGHWQVPDVAPPVLQKATPLH